MSSRHIVTIFLAVTTAFMISDPALAQGDSAAAQAQQAHTTQVPPQPAVEDQSADPGTQTRIVVDENDGTVRIIIDGREVVRIDDKGVFVDGSIKSTESLKTNIDKAAGYATGGSGQ